MRIVLKKDTLLRVLLFIGILAAFFILEILWVLYMGDI